MLQTRDIDIKGKTVVVSGFGNVAWGAVKKATQLGAKVITISGPDGYIYDPEGISGEKNEYMLELRASGEDICAPYADEFKGSKFIPGRKPWEQKADIYLTCTTTERAERRRCRPHSVAQTAVRSRGKQHGLHGRGC